ncbi:hypothetical protein FGO68_gene1893 [Halteria grandinella]|uniref:Uncharacterized protein n=1 Tax=Halteria grandinella TaxID=5974 RepID=A0A8J8SUJ0_HALGN|nr:hypothetical protein FGO68_gene1893 [Halteria grandinella]
MSDENSVGRLHLAGIKVDSDSSRSHHHTYASHRLSNDSSSRYPAMIVDKLRQRTFDTQSDDRTASGMAMCFMETVIIVPEPIGIHSDCNMITS